MQAIAESYDQRHRENLLRLAQLFDLHETLKANSEFSSSPAVDDILRAIIVFAHATLEDFLRTVTRKLLPYTGESVLNEVPLIGQNRTRSAKFSLGTLAHFKGKTVDEVVGLSIDAYLQHTNFNNTHEIAAHVEMLGIDPSKINGSFPLLEPLLERRHLIVHQADRVGPSNSDGPQASEHIAELRDVDADVILFWIFAVNTFVKDVLTQVIEIEMRNQRQEGIAQSTNADDQSTD